MLSSVTGLTHITAPPKEASTALPVTFGSASGQAVEDFRTVFADLPINQGLRDATAKAASEQESNGAADSSDPNEPRENEENSGELTIDDVIAEDDIPDLSDVPEETSKSSVPSVFRSSEPEVPVGLTQELALADLTTVGEGFPPGSDRDAYGHMSVVDASPSDRAPAAVTSLQAGESIEPLTETLIASGNMVERSTAGNRTHDEIERVAGERFASLSELRASDPGAAAILPRKGGQVPENVIDSVPRRIKSNGIEHATAVERIQAVHLFGKGTITAENRALAEGSVRSGISIGPVQADAKEAVTPGNIRPGHDTAATSTVGATEPKVKASIAEAFMASRAIEVRSKTEPPANEDPVGARVTTPAASQKLVVEDEPGNPGPPRSIATEQFTGPVEMRREPSRPAEHPASLDLQKYTRIEPLDRGIIRKTVATATDRPVRDPAFMELKISRSETAVLAGPAIKSPNIPAEMSASISEGVLPDSSSTKAHKSVGDGQVTSETFRNASVTSAIVVDKTIGVPSQPRDVAENAIRHAAELSFNAVSSKGVNGQRSAADLSPEPRELSAQVTSYAVRPQSNGESAQQSQQSGQDKGALPVADVERDKAVLRDADVSRPLPNRGEVPVRASGSLGVYTQSPEALAFGGGANPDVTSSRPDRLGADIPFESGAPGQLELHGQTRFHGITTPQSSTPAQAAPSQVLQVSAAIQNNTERAFDIHLSPAELGKVRITLSPSESGITVNILADRPETLDLLRRHADLLAQDFRDMGYDTAAFSFGAEDQGANDRAPAQSASDSLELVAPAEHSQNKDLPSGSNSRPVASGRIDLRV